MKNQDRFSWVHLSDLHFSATKTKINYQNDLADKIAEAVDDLKNRRNFPDPSCLFVTGDLIAGADRDHVKEYFDLLNNDKNTTSLIEQMRSEVRDQFANSIAWIRSLANDSRLDIDSKNVFIIPGNHEVFWPDESEALRELILKTFPRSKIRTRSEYNNLIGDNFLQVVDDNALLILSQLNEYRSAVRDSDFAHCVPNDSCTFRELRTFNSGKIQVEIFGLNTTWASTYITNHFPGLPTGLRSQIETLIRQRDSDPNALRFFLMHHPVGWSMPDERPAALERLIRHAEFVLRGHEHVEWISSWGAHHIEVAAPSTYTEADGVNGFTAGEIDVNTRNSRIFLRQYNELENEYEPRVLKGYTDGDGAWMVHSAKLTKQSAVPSEIVLRRYGFSSGPPRVVRSVPGATAVFDLTGWSAQTPNQQAESLAELWQAISDATEFDKSIIYSAITSISDGFAVFIECDDSELVSSILSLSRNVVDHLGSLGIGCRCGIDRGNIAISVCNGGTHSNIFGGTVNRARRMAYVANVGTVAYSIDAFCDDEIFSETSEMQIDPSRRAILCGETFSPIVVGLLKPASCEYVHGDFDSLQFSTHQLMNYCNQLKNDLPSVLCQKQRDFINIGIALGHRDTVGKRVWSFLSPDKMDSLCSLRSVVETTQSNNLSIFEASESAKAPCFTSNQGKQCHVVKLDGSIRTNGAAVLVLSDDGANDGHREQVSLATNAVGFQESRGQRARVHIVAAVDKGKLRMFRQHEKNEIARLIGNRTVDFPIESYLQMCKSV